jgi:peroxiredoxin
MKVLPAGAKAPDFRLPTVSHGVLSLADALHRGPVVLSFFKISCPTCQYALPFLERIAQGYRGQSVTVMGVSQNSREDTKRFQKEYGLSFPIGLDDPANYKVSNAFGLTYTPTTFLIAATGAIEISSEGWSLAEISAINNKICATLQAPPAEIIHAGEVVAEFRPG